MKRKVNRIERSLLPSWRSIALSILDRVQNRKIFINLGDSSTTFTESECIRAVSETLEESSVRNLLLNCMVNAEQLSPGSSYVTLSLIANDNAVSAVQGKRFSIDDIEKSLNKIIGPDATSIVIEAVKIAGRKGKILLQNNSSQVTEISYGTQICKWKPESSYFSSINQSKVSVQNCRVVFIDGIIESVAECHRLFQSSYEERIPLVIFARGFAEEVVATASVNMQRQTAQVIPVLIPFDEVGVNGMGDLASCFNSDVISSDKGQLISNIDIKLCATANRISCSHVGTEIEFKDNRVNDVVKNLTSRLNKESDHQSDLIRRRLEYLGSGAVTIKVGSEKKTLRNVHQDRIDFGIRYVRSCMIHGVCKFNGTIMPAKSISSGIECSESFKKLLRTSAVTLEVDHVVRPSR